jgi:hypothetical protein
MKLMLSTSALPFLSDLSLILLTHKIPQLAQLPLHLALLPILPPEKTLLLPQMRANP